MKETEAERETDRRETGRKRDRDRKRDWEKERQKERLSERETEAERETDGQRDRGKKTERYRGCGKKRQTVTQTGWGRGKREEGDMGGRRQRGRPILCRVPLLLLSATKDHQVRLAHASHTPMVTTPDTPRDLQAETNIYSL